VYAEVIMNILFLLLFLISLAFGANPRATADEGNGIDPHGGRVTEQGDEGNGLDPHGGRARGQSGLRIDSNG
jgi:hypothetical protein